MKNLCIKRVFATLALGLCVLIASAQTSTIKHIVDRGETLASIAKRYGVTQAKIVELNPDAGQFIYVGMELIIPVATQETPTQTVNRKSIENAPTQNTTGNAFASTGDNATNATQSDNTSEYGLRKGKWEPAIEMAYYFGPKKEEGDFSAHSNGCMITFGANYHFSNSFYAGARIGYEWITTSSSQKRTPDSTINTDTHSIALPLEIGFKFGDKFTLNPNAGVDLGYTVKMKQKQGVGSHEVSQDIKGYDKFGAMPYVGLRLSYTGIGVGVSYKINVNKKYDGESSGFLMFGLYFGF